jgi:TRAP-type C4-dicarboxylate transport system substrate-binding protein
MKRREFVKALRLVRRARRAGLVAGADRRVWKSRGRASAGLPTVEAIVRMGKKLRRKPTAGSSIQMYPLMQLRRREGDDSSRHRWARCRSRGSRWARWGRVVDELNVFNMPFLFRDEAHMRKVIDGPIGQELLDEVHREPQSRLVALGWMDCGHAQCLLQQAGDQARGLEGHEESG